MLSSSGLQSHHPPCAYYFLHEVHLTLYPPVYSLALTHPPSPPPAKAFLIECLPSVRGSLCSTRQWGSHSQPAPEPHLITRFLVTPPCSNCHRMGSPEAATAQTVGGNLYSESILVEGRRRSRTGRGEGKWLHRPSKLPATRWEFWTKCRLLERPR